MMNNLNLPPFPVKLPLILLVVGFLLLTTFMFLKLLGSWSKSKNCRLNLNLPPGPWKLPLIGNIHNLVGSLPHIALRNLSAKYGPIMYLKLGQVPTIVISSADAAREVLKTHDVTFADRPQLLAAKIMTYGCTDIGFAPYGDYWRQLRKICTLELLSQNQVQSFRSLREDEFLNLARWIASNEGSPINLTQKMYSTSFLLTSRAAFGKKTEGHEMFVSIVQEAIGLASGFDIADLYPSNKFLQAVSWTGYRLRRLHQQADRILDNIIHDHKLRRRLDNDDSQRREDLVDVLLESQEDDGAVIPITTGNIKAVILDMFIGGSETSATTVDWAMAEMIKKPRILKKAQAEVRKVFNGEKRYVEERLFDKLQYLKLVIKETLRLHPPVALITRECRERCKIDGYDIPAKARVLVNPWSIGRDPKLWDEAESFIPERFLDRSVDFKGNSFEYIPFGSGRRICPGTAFALANVELPLATLLYHFDWELPNGRKPEELVMTDTFGGTFRRQEDLMVIPVVKNPLHLPTD